MTAFYVPGLAGDARASDHAYGEMRRQLELDMGRRQSSRRIVSLWTRRGAVDCITEVGRPDPLRGGTVDRDLRHGIASAVPRLLAARARERRCSP